MQMRMLEVSKYASHFYIIYTLYILYFLYSVHPQFVSNNLYIL